MKPPAWSNAAGMSAEERKYDRETHGPISLEKPTEGQSAAQMLFSSKQGRARHEALYMERRGRNVGRGEKRGGKIKN